MKRIIFVSLLLVLIALFIPLLFSGTASEDDQAGETDREPSETSPPTPETSPSPPPDLSDAGIHFTVLADGGPRECTMAEYLPGSVAGEMPASFEMEALRAQAIAIRSYILYCSGQTIPKHPEAAVCTDPSCCKAYISQERLRELWGEDYDYNWEKIRESVRSTDSFYLSYDGEPIQAVFHSSSAGRTEASENIWSRLPYLVSVDSPEGPEDVPNYITTVEVSVEDFKNTVLASFPEAALEGAPDQWLGQASLFDSGRVEHVAVGGVSVSGGDMRRLFALRSTCFTLEFKEEIFQFTVTGYGHGVGMSQYGANVMAKAGTRCEDILAHYYPSARLTSGAGG